MQEYVELEAGHMEFLIQALDGEPEAVHPPNLPPLPTEAAPNLAARGGGLPPADQPAD